MTEQEEATVLELRDKTGWGAPRLAKETGLSKSAIGRLITRLKREAMTEGTPEGYIIKGKSTCRNAEGEIVLEWTKTDLEKEKTLELMQLAVDDMVEHCRGKSEVVPVPINTNSDLLAVYPIADVHMGLYSWADEVGTDWDTDKCEEAIVRGMEYLVKSAPDAETCLIPNLADFFHTDNERNQTERSGHNLDVDTRQAKVFLTGVRSYRKMIELALSKHKKVVCNFSKGNHDDRSILALAAMMMAYFENNDRVEINLPINPFAYFEFGVNMYGQHHGNLKKDRYPGIMAADQPQMWGRTKYRTFLTGHFHSESKYEAPGCSVECFRTPGGKDSWTHSSGYRSRCEMQVIIAHVKRGELSRNKYNMEAE